MTKETVADYFVVQAQESKRKLRGTKQSQWILLSGVSLVSLGILILVSWPLGYQMAKNIAVEMSPHSYKFQKWKDNPAEIIMSVYFFNWTNPEDIFNHSIKPSFVEMGPYIFKEHRFRINFTWNDNGTVTFNQKRYWYFDKDSPHPLTDKITTVNAVALSAAYKVRKLGYIHSRGLSTTFASLNTKVHIVKTVGELLFEGYDDQLITIARNLPFLPKGTVPEMDRFCWFYGRNGTTGFDGTMNMVTDIVESIGDIKRVNYQPRIPYHNGRCGEVRGSFGDIFPPNLAQKDLEVYTSELCRSVPVEFVGESDALGFHSYKYIVGQKFLDNGTKYPENKCYHEGENVHSGVYNVSLCRYGTPSFISLPHFYGADPSYGESIEGMKPDEKKHEFYIKLEPETGVPLDARGRVQVNMLIQKIPSITLFNKVPRLFLPIMWFEQKAELPSEQYWQMKIFLKIPTIAISFGSILLIIGLITFYYRFFSRRPSRARSNSDNSKSLISR